LLNSLISKAFQLFSTDAPKHSEAWMQLIQKISEASDLDQKTHAQAKIISVLKNITLNEYFKKAIEKSIEKDKELIKKMGD